MNYIALGNSRVVPFPRKTLTFRYTQVCIYTHIYIYVCVCKYKNIIYIFSKYIFYVQSLPFFFRIRRRLSTA